jgi:STE24 endopeptidase
VLDLAARARVRVGSVLTVDASRRTTAANAYVTGLGPTKRVVLFDTLLEHFSRDEVRLVIAHELAHVRERDVLRGLAFAAATAPAGALAVARLADRLAPAPGGRAAALALAASIVGTPVGLLSRGLSRRIEARADTFALELTDAPDASIAFERRIALRNLADPDPPAWVRALLGTHPSVVERIGIAEAYAAARGPRAS